MDIRLSIGPTTSPGPRWPRGSCPRRSAAPGVPAARPGGRLRRWLGLAGPLGSVPGRPGGRPFDGGLPLSFAQGSGCGWSLVGRLAVVAAPGRGRSARPPLGRSTRAGSSGRGAKRSGRKFLAGLGRAAPAGGGRVRRRPTRDHPRTARTTHRRSAPKITKAPLPPQGGAPQAVVRRAGAPSGGRVRGTQEPPPRWWRGLLGVWCVSWPGGRGTPRRCRPGAGHGPPLRPRRGADRR